MTAVKIAGLIAGTCSRALAEPVVIAAKRSGREL
jgi:hypothetical protein